ncbi:MAG: DNA gyrase inhibitor YacG [Pseudomonadota bacterium]
MTKDDADKPVKTARAVDGQVNDDLAPTGGRCPICRSDALRKYRPFCSKRCADVDLSRWMSGRYAIPGGDADEDEDGDMARAEALSQAPNAGGRLGGDDER